MYLCMYADMYGLITTPLDRWRSVSGTIVWQARRRPRSTPGGRKFALLSATMASSYVSGPIYLLINVFSCLQPSSVIHRHSPVSSA